MSRGSPDRSSLSCRTTDCGTPGRASHAIPVTSRSRQVRGPATLPPVQVRPLRIAGAFEFTPCRPRRPARILPRMVQGRRARSGHRATVRAAAGQPFAVGARRAARHPRHARSRPGQAKYVYCPRGAVLDVVVDIRVGSPTFGQWDAVRLDESDRRAVYIAEGLGHAFLSLCDETTVTYLCTASYNPTGDFGTHPTRCRPRPALAAGHRAGAVAQGLGGADAARGAGPGPVAQLCRLPGVLRADPPVAVRAAAAAGCRAGAAARPGPSRPRRRASGCRPPAGSLSDASHHPPSTGRTARLRTASPGIERNRASDDIARADRHAVTHQRRCRRRTGSAPSTAR